MNSPFPRLHRLLALCAFIAVQTSAFADFPDRSLTLIVPYAAGGPTDMMGRLFAEGLSRELGQPVVVENKGGASGLVGTGILARSKADGYTIGLLLTPVTAIAPLTQNAATQEQIRKLTPIAELVEYAMIMLVSQNAPTASVQDIVARARQRPGAVSYGSTGVGSTNHLSAEMLAHAAGLDMTHVPFKGNAPAASEVFAGRLDFMFDMPNAARNYINNGQMKPLAITATQRNPMFPTVPTLQELGYQDVVVQGWFGIMGPANMPDAVIARLGEAIERVKRSAQFSDRMTNDGFVVAQRTEVRAFERRLATERAFWKTLLETSGVKLE